MKTTNQPTARSEAELLGLALAGDEEAFLLLYQRLKNGIFRYAFYMTNSKSIAEEVTQEVFISLLKQGRHYRADRGEVAAFVFGIARNYVRRIERRERPYQAMPTDQALESLSENLVSESGALPDLLIRNELAERVRASIASLPDHYRQVVVLCDLCEVSYVDAAWHLQCAVGTIRSRLNRAHALLAQKLKPFCSPDPEVEASGPEGCAI